MEKKLWLIEVYNTKTKYILLAVLSLLLASCSGGKKEEKPDNLITVTDAVGRKVAINKDKRSRVLCIGAGALRLYSYVGDMSLLCAAEDIDRSVGADPFANVSRPYYDLYKGELSKLPSCGKGGPRNQAAEAEPILTCKPDVIISEYGDVDSANTLQDMVGVPVVTVSYGPKSVFDDHVKESLTLLGTVFGKEEKAKALNQYIADSETELKTKAASASPEEKKTLYIGCLGNWGTQDILSTSSSFPLFEVSHIDNAVKGISLAQGKIDKEKLISLNPDVMVLDAAGISNFKTVYSDPQNKADYDSLSAFKNNNVYLEMPFNAYYTNLEIALMDAYYLASIAYPDAYAGFDIAKKSDEITEAFLGQKMYDTIKSAPYSYGGFQKIENIQEFLKN